MRKLLLAFVLLFIWSPVQAQDSTKVKTNFHEIGIDAGPLVSRMLGASYNSYFKDDYLFLYRYHRENWALRAGVGGHINNDDFTLNDSIKGSSKLMQLSFRLGVERHLHLTNTFGAYYGLDLLATYVESESIDKRTSGGTNTRATKENGYGGSIFLGFRYQINQRISISTEYSYKVMAISGFNKRLFTAYPEYQSLVELKEIDAASNPVLLLTFNYNL